MSYLGWAGRALQAYLNLFTQAICARSRRLTAPPPRMQAYLNLFTGAIGNGNAMLGYAIAALTIFTHPEYEGYSAPDLAEAITQLTSVIGWRWPACARPACPPARGAALTPWGAGGLTGSFTALVNAAPLASSLAGNASRVGQMLEFMDVMEAEEERHLQARESFDAPRKPGPAELMVLEGITCRLPHGRLIVKNLDLVIAKGVNTVMQGPSGCGKTSLLRYIRGLWHLKRDEGRVVTQLPVGRGGVMYLPQRPYMFAGSLQRQVPPPPPPSRTKLTRRVPHPVLIGHAASLTPY